MDNHQKRGVMIYLKEVPFSVLALSLLFALLSCTPKPEEILKSYVEAYNSHDIDKVMSLYIDDVTFENVGVWTKQGKHEVRKITEWDAATHIHMHVSDIEVVGDTVTFYLIETNDWLKLAGIGEWHYKGSIVVHNGLIRKLRAEITEQSLKTFQKAWQSIMGWASKERSSELAELMPDGEFLYGEKVAKKWLVLLQEWREATQFNK